MRAGQLYPFHLHGPIAILEEMVPFPSIDLPSDLKGRGQLCYRSKHLSLYPEVKTKESQSGLLRKYICDCLGCIASYSLHEWVARFYIKLHGCNSRAILATVMLLFHQQVELIKSPHDRTILLMVVRERFS